MSIEECEGGGRKLRRAIVKEELVDLVQTFCKPKNPSKAIFTAIILNQFLYWGERVKDADAFRKEENSRLTAEGKKPIPLMHGWVYKSCAELAEETMLRLSPSNTRKHIKLLVDAGLLLERHNPNIKWDRIYQYRVDILTIRQKLDQLGYVLEGYTKLPNELRLPYLRRVTEADKELVKPADTAFHPSGSPSADTSDQPPFSEIENAFFKTENASSKTKNQISEIENQFSETKNQTSETENRIACFRNAIPKTTTEITTETTAKITTETTSQTEPAPEAFNDHLSVNDPSIQRAITTYENIARPLKSLDGRDKIVAYCHQYGPDAFIDAVYKAQAYNKQQNLNYIRGILQRTQQEMTNSPQGGMQYGTVQQPYRPASFRTYPESEANLALWKKLESQC